MKKVLKVLRSVLDEETAKMMIKGQRVKVLLPRNEGRRMLQLINYQLREIDPGFGVDYEYGGRAKGKRKMDVFWVKFYSLGSQ